LTDNDRHRVERAFRDHPPGPWPFLVAGDPDADATVELLRRFAALPVRGVEIGFPYSDSIADGPVIQAAFTRSLAAGLRVDHVFEIVRRARASVSYPILGMVSASIVYRIGPEALIDRAGEAGFDGLIVPDLSLEEAPELSRLAASAGLCLPMLVAPTTPASRQTAIAAAARGFLYYVAVKGTTGERRALPPDLAERVKRVRSASRLPVLVGFGISEPVHVREVCTFADGAIVGSALVRRITESAGADRARMVEDAVEFVAELCGD
jgi:tryptophan synthase alpha chain